MSCVLGADWAALLEASMGRGCSSCPVLLVLPLNTPENLVLSLLLRRAAVTSSVLSFELPDATSPLPLRRCSRKRLRADMRSSVEALGRERSNKMSRRAERRRCDIPASGCRGGASISGSCSSTEEREFTGRRSTRLMMTISSCSHTCNYDRKLTTVGTCRTHSITMDPHTLDGTCGCREARGCLDPVRNRRCILNIQAPRRGNPLMRLQLLLPRKVLGRCQTAARQRRFVGPRSRLQA